MSTSTRDAVEFQKLFSGPKAAGTHFQFAAGHMPETLIRLLMRDSRGNTRLIEGYRDGDLWYSLGQRLQHRI